MNQQCSHVISTELRPNNKQNKSKILNEKIKYGKVGSLNKIHSVAEMPKSFVDGVFLVAKLDGASCVAYYENGKREPSLSLLCEMSRYFNVSINYLITGEEFKKKYPSSGLFSTVDINFIAKDINIFANGEILSLIFLILHPPFYKLNLL